jgi:N-acylneuraminate cytidylyltransferase
MNIIAIIPARGGSKRLPKKNIRDFMGLPMIAWTIRAALESGKFKTVLVSTDCNETAGIAGEHGAECPFLRDAAHDDITPVSEATLHALAQAEDYYKIKYDAVVQMMPNCPLRSAATIRAMVDEFENLKADFMQSHARYGWLNPWWANKVDKETKIATPLFEKEIKARSQDLPPLYCPTGAIWMAGADALKKQRSFYGPGRMIFEMPWMEAVDIDDQDDWDMAEILFERLKRSS